MRRGASIALSLLVASFALPGSLGCARAPRSATGPAGCPSLDPEACGRARALVAAASTYADEAHDLVLASSAIASGGPGAALLRSHHGWQSSSAACARAVRSQPKLDPAAVDYAFVGVTVDGTLVSADSDLALLFDHPAPRAHDVGLVAVALVRDQAPTSFRPGASLVETARGGCSCEGASHFTGNVKYGATLAYAFRAGPQVDHVRALDFVRSALADPRVAVRESRAGRMTIDGLGKAPSTGGPALPLVFHVLDPVPVAYPALPIDELCDFPAPEVSPSPLDFGIAPYGTEAQRTVHVVSRAPVDLRALLGARTYVLPAGGALDLPLRWTPDGDSPGCETQTRDEAIPFLRLGGGTSRSARVLETIRTGRPSVERSERIVSTPAKPDPASTVRDWTCPPDFVRAVCRVENADGADVAAEPRGESGCHFACRTVPGGKPPLCHFDAVMACALHCAP